MQVKGGRRVKREVGSGVDIPNTNTPPQLPEPTRNPKKKRTTKPKGKGERTLKMQGPRAWDRYFSTCE